MILLYTVISFIIVFINSTVKYRDLSGTGTVKIWYRGIPWYREYRPSLVAYTGSYAYVQHQFLVRLQHSRTDYSITLTCSCCPALSCSKVRCACTVTLYDES